MEDQNNPQGQTPQAIDLETPEQKYARLYSGPPQQAPAPTPQSPQPIALPSEVVETLSALKNELSELKAQVVQPQPQVSSPPPQSQKTVGWVDKIREGDFEGAEKALKASILAEIEPEIKSKAYADARSATQVQLEVERHVQKVRQENPDIVRFERYLEAPVQARVNAAEKAGRIRSSDDFVREYKAAVDAEVLELRNLGLQYRADGKQEAMTRSQRVLDAFTPAPQQVADHTQANIPNTQQGESQDDYFARRQSQERRLRNLG